MQEQVKRRGFLLGCTGMFAAPFLSAKGDGDRPFTPAADGGENARRILDAEIARWHQETEKVSHKDYQAYLSDGLTRGFTTLEKLEAAAEKVLREAKSTTVTDRPAVWSVYNMGYVVKTRESVFSIDLVHRRDCEFAKILDFALVTHNHGDHWRSDFYQRMDSAGKTVISNFLSNYGAHYRAKRGGYVRGEKTFKIKDVEIKTSLIDHNDYLVDYTTAFEIKVGNWIMYHTGDSGKGTEPKLKTTFGRPDLWLFFPGCGIDTSRAIERVNAKRVVFGHLWELGHKPGHKGRLDEPLIQGALAAARKHTAHVSPAFWGERIQ